MLDENRRYELDDLEAWLFEAQPIMLRKQQVVAAAMPLDDLDPFEAYARKHCTRRTNVDERLAQMTYKGAGNTSIHLTQLACSAAMLNAGMAVDDVVAILLDHTKLAAGAETVRDRQVSRACPGDFVPEIPVA